MAKDTGQVDDKTFLTHVLKSTKREGIEDLILYMEDCGFFDSPCSSKFHLSCEGGLAEHTRNVLTYAEKLGVAWLGGTEYNNIQEHVIIAAVLHDLGKMGQFDKPLYIPNILKSGSVGKQPYKTNPDLLDIPHEVRSIAIAQTFIDLTEEEQFAILYHNGLYGDFKYEINGKETLLYMIIHFADMWVSRIVEIEKEKTDEGNGDL